jgi:hypothetical protein
MTRPSRPPCCSGHGARPPPSTPGRARWLTTRTFELAVHGLDLADAAGLPASVPHEVLVDAVTLAARVGVEVGDGATVLLALTGRHALPAGFCVL